MQSGCDTQWNGLPEKGSPFLRCSLQALRAAALTLPAFHATLETEEMFPFGNLQRGVP